MEFHCKPHKLPRLFSIEGGLRCRLAKRRFQANAITYSSVITCSPWNQGQLLLTRAPKNVVVHSASLKTGNWISAFSGLRPGNASIFQGFLLFSRGFLALLSFGDAREVSPAQEEAASARDSAKPLLLQQLGAS